jgi:hypothetical protein
MMFQITITNGSDLLGIRTADSAPEMEDMVTSLHVEFPGATTKVDTVRTIPHPQVWPHYIDNPR